ncbi:hypothetical protein FSO04_31435 [Paraburkholderia madseniana]|uniref:Uncharacterized protein n=1 Tax=Paraburkholderia madseniana TaxID=2599607 RepID=A0A6N6W6B2_9BURK|nr:hypothetical protein [Paraburkholderia madseniana]KAE8755976.1 hypothetical protein FSO04_31435 [Paraburkholderia madseniana]
MLHNRNEVDGLSEAEDPAPKDEEITTELFIRIHALESPEHLASECAQSARGVLTESFLWILAGIALWVLAIHFLV